jgi:hypothetical protein
VRRGVRRGVCRGGGRDGGRDVRRVRWHMATRAPCGPPPARHGTLIVEATMAS